MKPRWMPQQLVEGAIYSFDLVMKPKKRGPIIPLMCPPADVWPPCHVAVFQGLERTKPQHRELLWDKVNCPVGPEEDQEQEYSDQGDYCIYHVHHNLFSLF